MADEPVLTPAALADDETYLARDVRKPSADAVLKIEHESLERGSLTVYLEPGEAFELRNDEPTRTTVTALDPTTDHTDQ